MFVINSNYEISHGTPTRNYYNVLNLNERRRRRQIRIIHRVFCKIRAVRVRTSGYNI